MDELLILIKVLATELDAAYYGVDTLPPEHPARAAVWKARRLTSEVVTEPDRYEQAQMGVQDSRF